jgi:hypothetical protein
VAWKDAKEVAEEWAAEHLPADLHGRILELVNFETDEDTEFFYPGRREMFHRMITKGISRIARKRGARTMYLRVTPADYLDLCEKDQVKDSPEERTAFITACHRIREGR